MQRLNYFSGGEGEVFPRFDTSLEESFAATSQNYHPAMTDHPLRRGKGASFQA